MRFLKVPTENHSLGFSFFSLAPPLAHNCRLVVKKPSFGSAARVTFFTAFGRPSALTKKTQFGVFTGCGKTVEIPGVFLSLKPVVPLFFVTVLCAFGWGLGYARLGSYSVLY